MKISIIYEAKWRLKSNARYVWTTCKKMVDLNTSREVKKTIFGNSNKAGYYVDGRFIKCEDLAKEIELIPKKEYCPF